MYEFINDDYVNIININNNIGYAAGYNYAFSKIDSSKLGKLAY